MTSRLTSSFLTTICAFAFAATVTPGVQAQSAQFEGAQLALGNGFNLPYGIALDSKGDLYVADSGTDTVKEILAVNGVIPASPVVNVIASGFNGPTGIALDANGNIFVADAYNNALKEIVAVNGSIPATPVILTLSSSFSLPYGVAVDTQGDVFVADAGTSEIYELLAVNGSVPPSPVIRTLASNFGFGNPGGIAVDSTGNVFVGDTGNSAVEEIVAVNGSIPATPTVTILSSNFSLPYGIVLDANENLYVADAGTNAVSEILAVNGTFPASPVVETILSDFSTPIDTAIDPHGNIYISDTGDNAIVELLPGAYNFGPVAVGSTGAAIALDFTFTAPGSIGKPALLTQGATGLDFADAGTGSCTTNGASYAYNAGDTCTVNVTLSPKYAGTRAGAVTLEGAGGAPIATGYVFGSGTGPQLAFAPGVQSTLLSGMAPAAIAIDGTGSLYVADAPNNQVLKQTLSGSSYMQSAIGSGLALPSAVTVDGAGNVYIADTGNSRILKETLSSGTYTQSIVDSGAAFAAPVQSIAVDGAGNVYIAAASVTKETAANGSYTASVMSTGSLQNPLIAVDAAGDLYAAASGQVIEITLSSGALATIPVASGLNDISGIAVDEVGNVYIADTADKTIVKETLTSGSYVQSSVAMTFTGGPAALTTDSGGLLYVVDTGKQILEDNFAASAGLTFATATLDGTTDTADGVESVVVTNNGTAVLAGNLATPEDFLLSSGSGTPADCTATLSLAAGASCNLGFEFAPAAGTSAGAVTGSAVLTDNNLNAAPNTTQAIALSGTATLTAASTHLVLTTTQSSVTAGTAITITITAEDGSNSVVSTDNGTVTLGSTDTAAMLPVAVTLNGGTATFQATLVTAGNQNVTGTQGASTGSIALNVAPGPLAQLHALAGTNQSAYEGAAFATQLQVQGMDTFGNTVAGAVLVFNAPSTGASVIFATPYLGNTYQTSATTGANGIAVASVATANNTAGQYTVSVSAAGFNIPAPTYSLTNLGGPEFIVTVLTDDAGTASNCINQAPGSATGNNASCSLRDAVAASNALAHGTSSIITFANGVNGSLAVTNGPLTLNNNVSIAGPAAAQLTIDGGGSTSLFTVPAGIVASLSNVALSHGNSSMYGGAIGNDGTLTLTSVTLNNNAAQYGGAVFSDGTLVLINDTLSSNSAQTYGGAIDNAGTLIITNSTISGNTAQSYGGGIDSTNAPAMTNSIVAGNTAATYADIYANTSNVDPSNIASLDPSGTSQINPLLAALGSYGGSLQTMIPLPGSPAICNGALADISSTTSTDERGNPRTTAYGQTTCVDAGAVQTNYTLTFAQQPSATPANSNITPAPSVQLSESGAPFKAAVEAIGLTLNGSGPINGNSASTSTSDGDATYSSLSVGSAGTGDTLTASITLNSSKSTSISVTSNAFDIDSSSSTFTVVSGSSQSAVIGTTFTQPLTVKVVDASSSPVAGATVVFGAPSSGASVNLSSTSIKTDVNGIASVSATANGLASATAFNVIATTSGNAVSFSLTNAQAATTLTVLPSATAVVYGQPLTIKATVAPAAVLTSTPTGSITFYDGTTALAPSVTVASASASETVVGTVGNHTYKAQYGGDSNFIASALASAASPVTVGKATSTIVPPSAPLSFSVGAGGAIDITLAGQYAGKGISLPSGTVSYSIGTGTAQTVAIVNGAAALTLPSSLAAGNYSMSVSYAGDTNYSPAASIAIPFSISTTAIGTVSTTTVLTSSPTSSDLGSSVTLSATVTSATGTTIPTGLVTFNFGTVILGTATLSNTGAATFMTTSLPVGSDLITAVYAGDANHTGSTSAGVIEAIAAPSFSLSVNPGAISIPQGGTGTVQFTLTAINGFSQPVTLSCSGLPAESICTFPNSITPTAAGVVSKLTINTNINAASVRPNAYPSGGTPASGALTYVAGAGLAGLALLLGFPARKRFSQLTALRTVLAALALGSALACTALGCGAVQESPLGTSTVTITATSSTGGVAISQSTSIQLTITK